MLEADRKYKKVDFWKAAEHFDLKLPPSEIAEQADNYIRMLPTPEEKSFILTQTEHDLKSIEPLLNKNMFIEGFFSLHFSTPPNSSRLLGEAVKLTEHFKSWKDMTSDFYASHTGDVSQEISQTVSSLTLNDLREYAKAKHERLEGKLLQTRPDSVERVETSARHKTWKTYEQISSLALVKEEQLKGNVK